jgi:hypothetical protein
MRELTALSGRDGPFDGNESGVERTRACMAGVAAAMGGSSAIFGTRHAPGGTPLSQDPIKTVQQEGEHRRDRVVRDRRNAPGPRRPGRRGSRASSLTP